MSLGDQFVDGSDVDSRGVGQAIAGSIFGGVFIAIISFIDSGRQLVIGIIDGIAEWAVSAVYLVLNPESVLSMWRLAADSLTGLLPAPLAVPLLTLLTMVATAASVWALRAAIGRMLG